MFVFIDRLFNHILPLSLSLSLSPAPSSRCASQLANVLEIDLDLVKVGFHSLQNVRVTYRLKGCFSQEERKPADLGNLAPAFKVAADKTGG